MTTKDLLKRAGAQWSNVRALADLARHMRGPVRSRVITDTASAASRCRQTTPDPETEEEEAIDRCLQKLEEEGDQQRQSRTAAPRTQMPQAPQEETQEGMLQG